MPLQKQHFQKTKTVLYASDEGKRFGRYDRRRTEHCGRGAAGSGKSCGKQEICGAGSCPVRLYICCGPVYGVYFNSRIRVNDGLQDLYGIPQIGVVVKDSKKKLFLDRWVNGLRHYGKREFTAEQSMELAFAAIKIAAAKNGQNNICLMGCNLEAGADKVCEGLKAALEKEGLSVTILNNVLYDAEAMEKVSAAQGAVLVEKAGSTLYNEIVAELELLKRLEIPVLGGITVE